MPAPHRPRRDLQRPLRAERQVLRGAVRHEAVAQAARRLIVERQKTLGKALVGCRVLCEPEPRAGFAPEIAEEGAARQAPSRSTGWRLEQRDRADADARTYLVVSVMTVSHRLLVCRVGTDPQGAKLQRRDAGQDEDHGNVGERMDLVSDQDRAGQQSDNRRDIRDAR